MSVTIDPVAFWDRVLKLREAWQAERGPDGLWKGADAVVIVTGAPNEDVLYSKSGALHTWLLGYEFTDTIFVFASRAVHVLTHSKKVALMEPLKSAENATVPLELLARDKTDNSANYAKLIEAVKSSHAGKCIGSLGKEDPLGAFAAQWKAALKAEGGFSAAEVAPALAALLATKDAKEQACVKRAALLSAMLMQKALLTRIEDVVEKEEKVSHEKLAEEAEEAFSDPKAVGLKLAPEFVESCYTPIIQSGGSFDLRPSAFSNEENLHFGTITCSLGARYKSYCANVGRTYVINPSKAQERNYKLLLELQKEAINALRPGATLSAAYAAAQSRLKSKNAALEPNLFRNCGFGMGIEFREPQYQLNSKTEAVVSAGMVFNVAVGFEKLVEKEARDKGRNYALFVADTVLVTESGVEVLTDRAQKEWTDVSYNLNDDDDEADETADVSSSRRGNVEILDSRTRGKNSQQKHQETNDLLSAHQSKLEETMREEALRRIAENGNGPSDAPEQQSTPIAYRDPNQYPTSSSSGNTLKLNQTHVDGNKEAVLIPVFGRLVPFHISTIKNVSKSEEGVWTFLRINFVAPGGGGIAAQQLPPEADGNSHFIREITLKARVPTNLNNTFRLIRELRKRVQAREKQVALESDLVTQEPLQLIRTGRIHRLRDISVRPSLGGKKGSGTLELHANGLRFMSPRGESLDLNFKNIKLAFFQPADKEIIVLMHFHLHNPIMMGKKKTKDVQFYVEVMEASYALDNHRRSGYDPDELEEEQRERALRNRMNQEFQNFTRKVEEAAKDLEFDIPYRDLGFYGVPPHNRANCFIMPAVNALVELVEPPWFVVPLNDIEVAHFERVVYGLKNFDMVIVLKDFKEKPLHVNAINTEHLDPLKTWLDSCNIKFYEGPANLNWGQIMKNINETGLEGFYDDGGWKFLNMQASSDEEEDSEDAESDFEPEEEEEEEEESDDDDDEYADSDDTGSGEESLDSDESEGKDWEELDKEAEKSDKKRAREAPIESPAKKKPGQKRRK